MVVKNNHISPLKLLGYCCSTLLAIICVVTFAIDLYFNISFVGAHGHRNRYGKYTPFQLVNRYPLQITPSSWVFYIWPILYILLIIWFFYVFYLILCRQLFSGFKNKGSLFPSIFWLLFIMVNVLNAVWLYLFTRQDMIISGVVLIILTVMLYVLNLMAYHVCWADVTYADYKRSRNDNDNDCECDEVEKDDRIKLSHFEVILLRFLTLNGLPLYAIWCTLTACLQWAMIFKYFLFHWSDNVSCIVALAILTSILLIYWGLDLLLARKYMVWTWLTCGALITLFAAIICKHHSIGGMRNPALLFAFILLIVSAVVVVIKAISLCLWRPKYDNIHFSRV